MTVGVETKATFSIYCSVMIYRPNNINKVSKPEHFQFQSGLQPVNKTACSFSFTLTFCCGGQMSRYCPMLQLQPHRQRIYIVLAERVRVTVQSVLAAWLNDESWPVQRLTPAQKTYLLKGKRPRGDKHRGTAVLAFFSSVLDNSAVCSFL